MAENEGKIGERITSETVRELDNSQAEEGLRKIEAALFLAARFLSVKDLVLLTDINPLMVQELLEQLSEKYNHEHSAIEIINKDNMWKMDVKKEYFNMINKLATGSSEFTKAEQETLAVIAYKQPVKQSIIVKIRGNKAYEHIKKFLESGLLLGKKIGHTMELKLSDEFFDYFHLQNNSVLNGIDESDIKEDSSSLQNVILDDHPNSNDGKEFGDLQGYELKPQDDYYEK